MELYERVAKILGLEVNTVKWDTPQRVVIEKLVDEIEERDKYIQYVTGFPFREVLDNDKESNPGE